MPPGRQALLVEQADLLPSARSRRLGERKIRDLRQRGRHGQDSEHADEDRYTHEQEHHDWHVAEVHLLPDPSIEGVAFATDVYGETVIGRMAIFSSHAVVRRKARRRPLVLLWQFLLVSGCAGLVGFAIAQLA